MHNGWVTVEKSLVVLGKVRVTIWPWNCTLGIYTKELKRGTQTHGTAHSSRKVETNQMFINGSMDQWVNTFDIHIQCNIIQP